MPTPARLGAMHSAVPHPVPEIDVLTLPAVLRGGGDGELRWTSPAVTLVFDTTGIVIVGQRPGERLFLPWTAETRVIRGASEPEPGAGSVTPVRVESPGRVLEFSVSSPHRDPVALRALADRVARWSGPGAPAPATVVPFAPAPVPLTWGYGRYWPSPSPPPPRRRTRRIGLLVGALACIGAGVGLALALSGSGGSRPSAATSPAPPAPDQALADRLMLTRPDLPAGWSIGTDNSSQSNSPKVQAGQARITRVFARCMGISDDQAAATLGGGATDQTAQSSSPVFLGPPSSAPPGSSLEVQTGASIVRSHRDEQTDFALLISPRFPQCAGAAFASETQLGADSSSGRTGRPGPPSVSVVDVAAPPGVQVSALLVSFTVSDGSASVPVQVETVSLGHDRIEANFQALAIGGQVPTAALTSPLSVFADRVAGSGQIAEA